MCDAEKVKALAERANELNCVFQEFIQDVLGRLNDRVEEAPADDKSSHTTSQPRKIQKQSGYQDVHGPANYSSKQTLQKGKIDDSTILSYTCFLKEQASPEAVKDVTVQLNIQGDFTSGSDLLKEINRLQVNVAELKLHKYFKTCTRPDTKCQEEINHIMKRCSIQEYRGAYVEGMRLPSGDTCPYLSVATSADYRSLTEELHKNKGRLSDLNLCVSSEIAASDLKEPIPVEGGISLFLPDASDIEETSKMAKALLPLSGEFQMLYFPRCGMKSSSGEMERLLQNLLHLRVKVGGAVFFPSTEKPGRGSAEGRKLKNLARQLGASYGIEWWGEETMWSF